MDESSVRPNGRPGCAQEGNNIVIDFAFDLSHPLDIAIGSPNGGHCAVRDTTLAVPRLAHGLLDREPRVDPLPLTPDCAHFGTGVTLDHLGSRAPCFGVATLRRVMKPD